MQPVKLVVNNFKSFIGRHEFDFLGGKPGLYYVTGVNKVEPRLEANATGKSTLLTDALLWVCYGKTSRGLKAGNVVPWDSYKAGKRVSAEFTFHHSGADWKLTRTRNPIKLVLQKDEEEPRNAQQGEVDTLLGMDYLAATNAVYMRQMGDMFFDLSPGPRMELFSTVFGLQKWERAAELASTRMKKLEKDAATLREQVSYHSGSVQQIRSQLKEAKREATNWKDQQKDRITELRQEVEGLKQQAHQAKEHYKSLEVDEVADEQRQEQLRENLEKSQRKRRNLQDKIIEYETWKRQYEKRIEEISKELAEAKEQGKDRTCPTCGQNIPAGEVEGHVVANLESILEDSERRLDHTSKALAKLVKDDQDQHKQETRLEKLIRKHDSEIYSAQRKVQKAERELERCNDNLESTQLELQEAKRATNPYLKQKQRLAGQLKDTKTELATHKRELTKVEEEQDKLEFWKSGFKEVRLLVSQRALGQLEVEINNALVQLGLENDWQITLDVERATKGGSVQRGLMVFVQNAKSSQATPWEAWSGGESQRLRLAGAIGISEMVRNNCGVSPAFEVWDEPTTHVNPGGVDELIDILWQRSRETNRQLWLVEHSAFDSGRFDGTLRIAMDKQGSHIEEAD